MLPRVEASPPGAERPAAIGPYQLLGPLGEGGVGIVYRARDTRSGEEVALKTVRVARAAHLSSVRRETWALQKIRHPGIVRILESGVDQGRPWYAMELLAGETLEARIGGRARPSQPGDPSPSSQPPIAPDEPTLEGVPPSGFREASRRAAREREQRPVVALLADTLTLFRRLCAPLGFLHGEGLVHRDVKPSNIFVRPDGTPALMDFGLVGRRHGALGREVLEEAAAFVGTVAYMAPEQVRGEGEDARTDLYALGCVLYQALTGRLPFYATTNAEMLQHHLGTMPDPPSRWVSGVPAGLDDLVLRLLAKSPRDRIGHADDVARKLAELGAEDWPVPVLPARAYLYQPRLVGRRAPLEEIKAALYRAAEGQGALVLVGGESGIGKTALAAELARAAHQDGVTVVTGQCLAAAEGDAERASPLHPFRLLLRRIGERCVAGGPPVIARLLGRHQRLLASVDPALAALPADAGAAEPAPLPAQAARERMLEALTELVVAFAEEKPLLLVLDDLHWADELSLSLLALLGQRAAQPNHRLLLLATYRSEEVSPALQALFGERGVRRLELGRLDARDLGVMVADMLGVAEPPAELVRFVAGASEGNPFFVAEYLRTALAEGWLFRDEQGRWQRAENAGTPALALPRTLRELALRRLAGLGEGARTLAEMAAVLGREAELDLLAPIAASALAEDAWLAAASELVARQVMVEAPAGALSFVHQSLRQIVYEGVPAERAGRLHGLCAEAIEARDAGTSRLPLAYARLARHHRAAGNVARAVDYLEKAGEQALAQSANGDAAACFEEALRAHGEGLVPADELRRARWERLAGEALQGLGKLSDSKGHLRRAVELLGWPEPRSTAGLVLRLLLEMGRQLIHRLFPWLVRRSGAAVLEAARAYDRLFQVYYYEAAPLPLFHANLRTLNLAERALPSPELACAYANAFAASSILPGMRGAARAYLRRAEETVAAVADPAVESYLELLRAVNLSAAGQWRESDRRIQRSIEIATELGFRRRWEEATGVLAFNQLIAGDIDASLASADAVLRSAARGDNQTQCWSLLERAQARLALGFLDEALADARAAERLCLQLGRDERIWAHGTLALVAYRRGNLASAREAGDRARAAIAGGPPIMSACLDAYAGVAEVFLSLWESAPDAATRKTFRKAARSSCRALRAFARTFSFARPRADLRRGDLLWLEGRRDQARAAWQSARAGASALSMFADEGLAVLRLAERCAPATEKDALVTEAVALLTRAGQHHLASRARERPPS
jgi:serine/threonine protein kinase